MKKTIGIIGGMGPAATVDLFKKIIYYTDAKKDQEHIRILVDNNTKIPDRTQAILKCGVNPIPYIIDTAKKLELIGADILVMPCNTSHYFYDAICECINIPLVNMIEETVIELVNSGVKVVGVLATDGVYYSNVYGNMLKRYGVKSIWPSKEEQIVVMNLIYEIVKAGGYKFDISMIKVTIENMYRKGASKVILGCTELPIAFSQYNISGDYIDPTEILAKKAIELAGYAVRRY